MIFKMGMELKLGQMDQNMEVIIKKGKSMDKELILGAIVQNMLVNGLKIGIFIVLH